MTPLIVSPLVTLEEGKPVVKGVRVPREYLKPIEWADQYGKNKDSAMPFEDQEEVFMRLIGSGENVLNPGSKKMGAGVLHWKAPELKEGFYPSILWEVEEVEQWKDSSGAWYDAYSGGSFMPVDKRSTLRFKTKGLR